MVSESAKWHQQRRKWPFLYLLFAEMGQIYCNLFNAGEFIDIPNKKHQLLVLSL